MVRGGLSSAKRFMRLFLLVVVAPVLLILILYNMICTGILLEKTSLQTVTSMEQYAAVIRKELDRISIAAVQLGEDEEYISMLNSYHSSQNVYERHLLYRKIIERSYAAFGRDYLLGGIYAFYPEGDPGGGSLHFIDHAVLDLPAVRKTDWYRAITDGKRDFLITVNQGVEQVSARLTSELDLMVAVSGRGHGGMQALVFTINMAYFRTLNFGHLGGFLIIDGSGRVVLSGDGRHSGKDISALGLSDTLIGNGIKSKRMVVEGAQQYVTTYPVSRIDWLIVNLIPYDQYTGDMRRLNQLELVGLALITLLFAFFIRRFFHSMLRPVDKLIDKMELVKRGDFSVRAESSGDAEMRYLVDTFNRMLEESQRLIAEQQRSIAERNEAKFSALQAQINPHFINNTLNAIRLMAMMVGNQNIEKMTGAFMVLLNSTLNIHQTTITLEDELNILANYAYVMQIRYGGKFRLEVVLPPECRELIVLKMLFQPIVENAILHGLIEKEQQGVIHVSCEIAGDRLHVMVEDNGIGMSQEKVRCLLGAVDAANQRGFTSIGVANVNQRIKLYYGKDFGLMLHSEEGRFTRVTIVLPVVRPSEDRLLPDRPAQRKEPQDENQ